ncbi:alpha/beta hydrolase-fold protein [Nannocystis sp. SCPEA4]|uniref:alpha/beta hydrolase n=1 Tax=Nannocystis sp. SCPEA4 TaxID=2996787 RepID=UPI00226E135F|nr:alpha/beta hydrolase-fold protein [Nannocystis sp. SCPEA4]MCY1059405.1 alpha/beta hydrolase-fold protein [Nannocystis sp. SCPEA4]
MHRCTVPLACLLTCLCACAAPRAESAAAPGELVIGRSITIDSQVLGETRRINIYTPPGHDTGGPPLPVLYMPDGGMHEDFHHITGIVQVSTANGTMRPFLVVGIENTERRRDLTGPTDDPEDRKIAPRVGGSAAFRRFIREELMPEIQQRFRTTDESAIVGESLAGLFVLETFFLEPELFDTYIAIDPSVWWNRGSLVKQAVPLLQRPGQPRTLYVATSDEPEMQRIVRSIGDALRQVDVPGVRWHHEPMPDEHHSTIFHASALRAFRTLLAPAAAEPTHAPGAVGASPAAP